MKEIGEFILRQASTDTNGNIATTMLGGGSGGGGSEERGMERKVGSDSGVLKDSTNINKQSMTSQVLDNKDSLEVQAGRTGQDSADMANRRRLSTLLKTVRANIRYLHHVVREFHSYLDNLARNLDEITTEILERVKTAPAGLEIYAATLIQDVEEEHDKESARIKDKIDEFEAYIKLAKAAVLDTEEIVRANEENSLKQADDLISRLSDIEANIPVCPVERCIYMLSIPGQTGTGDSGSLEARLGAFDKVSVPWRIQVRRTGSFRPDTVGARFVTAICAASDEEVWVVWHWGPQIHRIDKEGRVQKTISAGCKVDDICLDFDGNLVLSCHESRCIKRLDSNFEVKQTIEVEKVPRGVKFASPREMVVCCVQNLHHRNGDQSCILRLDAESKSVSKEIDDSLIQPWRIAVNINGDICVSDRNKGTVTIFDSHGNVKATYAGPDTSTRHAFAPHGICCDEFGQILVVDYVNHTVHVLDPLGRFRGFLIMDKELEKLAIFMGTSSPFSIGLDKTGDLWVGNKYGFLTVLKYAA